MPEDITKIIISTIFCVVERTSKRPNGKIASIFNDSKICDLLCKFLTKTICAVNCRSETQPSSKSEMLSRMFECDVRSKQMNRRPCDVKNTNTLLK